MTLTPRRYDYLSTLHQIGPCTVYRLAREMGVFHTTAWAALDRLRRDGYVEHCQIGSARNAERYQPTLIGALTVELTEDLRKPHQFIPHRDQLYLLLESPVEPKTSGIATTLRTVNPSGWSHPSYEAP
jgi:DNA-binding MarR family transcriptional regulator